MSFTRSKIVGLDVAHADYVCQIPRGKPEFVMSRGELCEFALCPAKWLAGGEEEKETDALIWGTAIDVLGPHPERFDELYAVAPSTYRNEKGEERPWNWNALVCKSWRDEQGEKTVIKHELQTKLIQALKALRESPVQSLFDCSKTQVHVVGAWKDEETGLEIPVQCLVDLVPDKDHWQWGKSLCNVKTARSGDPNTFPRVIEDNAYDLGAALDLDLYTTATNEDRVEYAFLLQENVKPFHVTFPVPALSVEFISYGRSKVQSALRFYSQCLATNTWPSYSTGGRLVFGPCQYLDPSVLFKYRESGGAVNRD